MSFQMAFGRPLMNVTDGSTNFSQVYGLSVVNAAVIGAGFTALLIAYQAHCFYQYTASPKFTPYFKNIWQAMTLFLCLPVIAYMIRIQVLLWTFETNLMPNYDVMMIVQQYVLCTSIMMSNYLICALVRYRSQDRHGYFLNILLFFMFLGALLDLVKFSVVEARMPGNRVKVSQYVGAILYNLPLILVAVQLLVVSWIPAKHRTYPYVSLAIALLLLTSSVSGIVYGLDNEFPGNIELGAELTMILPTFIIFALFAFHIEMCQDVLVYLSDPLNYAISLPTSITPTLEPSIEL